MKSPGASWRVGFRSALPKTLEASGTFPNINPQPKLTGEAASVGKGLLGKLTSTLKSVVTSVVPKQKEQVPPTPYHQRESTDDYLQGLGSGRSGLLDRALGGGLGGLFGGLMRQAAERQQQMQAQMSDLQRQVVHILRNNPEAQRHLGRDVSIMAVSRQASSTMIVNGKQSKREDLELVVAGSNGQGIVEAKTDNGNMRLKLVLPNGRIIQLNALPEGRHGDPIDVEFREIR